MPYTANPVSNPAIPLTKSAREAPLFRTDQEGSLCRVAKTIGIWSVKPINTTTGRTNNHKTSGDRTVICVGSPPHTNRNNRIKLKAVNPFTPNSTANNTVWVWLKCVAKGDNAQNVPRGGIATNALMPTKKAIPGTGRRDHKPPN